jgi:hypothetical protein
MSAPRAVRHPRLGAAPAPCADYLARLMRERGEGASAVLDDRGRLSGRDAWQVIADRKEGQS